jgi:hypothetical protein
MVVLEMLFFKGKKGMALKYQFYIAIYTKKYDGTEINFAMNK